jgi:hypothetical protein
VLERGPRTAGHSALALWFTRPVAATPSEVTLRLVDPLGRVTERTVTIPGWTAPPPIVLQITQVTAIAGRGVVVSLTTDAPLDAAPPFVIGIRVVQTLAGSRLPFPVPPGPVRRPRFRSMSGSFPLDAVPLSSPAFHPGPTIQVVRMPHAAGDYAAWIPLTAPVRIDITITAADGRHTTVSVTA